MATIHAQTVPMSPEQIFRPTVFPASEAATLVGATPVARYASWADHRSEIRRWAEDAKAHALARRAF